MTREEVATYTALIYVAGPQAEAENICRQFCLSGLCVTVEPVEFIYTGGQERGVRVGLINYPNELIEGLHQHSASIVATDRTVWLSRREAALPDTPTHGNAAAEPRSLLKTEKETG